jgi:hypothetical protein
MSIEDHPSLSHMSPEAREEYVQWAKFAGREIQLPESESKAVATEEILYIDRQGMYGDASGMLIIKVSDFSAAGMTAFEKAKDTMSADDLMTWAMGYLGTSGKDVGMTFIGHTSKIFPGAVVENSKGILKRLRGRK